MRYHEAKRIIENRLRIINEILDTEYHINYCSYYGGYAMYLVDVHGGHHYGQLGFSCRKSSTEMVSYLEGVLAGMRTNKTA